MALKLIVFACVLALCYCQMPARPMIPETFTAKVDVERHRAKETVFGKGDLVVLRMVVYEHFLVVRSTMLL